MKRQIPVFFLVLASVILQGHEFWMEPDKFRVQPGEQIIANFKVGENFSGESWDLKKSRIEKLAWFHKAKTRDLRTSLQEGQKDHFKIALQEEGTHLVVMESNHAFIALDGKSFN